MKGAGFVIPHCDTHPEGLLRQEILNVFRPLYYAGVTAVKVIVQAYVQGLFWLGNAIEIKMIEGISRCGAVLVDNGS